MSWLEVIVLGLIQGLTEFLPVSSSGHLRIASEVLFGSDPGAAFTAVTQIGTEAAVIVYFARDIWHLFRTWLRGFTDAAVRRTDDYRLAWMVVVGSIPIAVLGVLFKDRIETVARNLWLVAVMLIVFGILLGLAERFGTQHKPMEKITWRDGVVLGFAQAMALIPGVSRSGGTITAGLFLGINRPAIARYSFLLAIPSVFGAGLFTLPDVLAGDGPSGIQMIVAVVIAFVVGYAVIAWLLRFVQNNTVYVFVAYRIALGTALLAALSIGAISAT
ncbi:undecaprenyl-diphosphate phosphatase [Pseudonocardia sp. HH130630-07]|uniref:undecaprenyl-diphosphate phosphatase n=1 Tax=Pseudonocardia sp. HH130630-07 TaxID=1690815 RepID=UPI000814F971|nr:undecaprenyl-diphosphate phosphatase [Pseudonocardia sp. HH130630-07]ANY10184.1 undecaprenyl-diphosphatase [Pseudonocardia sp. HH130630-07]